MRACMRTAAGVGLTSGGREAPAGDADGARGSDGAISARSCKPEAQTMAKTRKPGPTKAPQQKRSTLARKRASKAITVVLTKTRRPAGGTRAWCSGAAEQERLHPRPAAAARGRHNRRSDDDNRVAEPQRSRGVDRIAQRRTGGSSRPQRCRGDAVSDCRRRLS